MNSPYPHPEQFPRSDPPSTPEAMRDLRPVTAREHLKLDARNCSGFQSFVTQRAFLGSELLLRQLIPGHRNLIPSRPEIFSEAQLRMHLPADRPTLGFTLSNPNKEMVLVAMAAAHMRKIGEFSYNTLFIPPNCLGAAYVKETQDGCRLFTRRGIVVSADGGWQEGKFAVPVPIDLVGTFSGKENALLQTAEKFGIPFLNDQRAFDTGRNKALTKKLLSDLGIQSPASFIIDVDTPQDQWMSGLLRFVAQHEIGEVVVKPTSGSHGTGVTFHRSTDTGAIKRTITRNLAADAPAVIIDERIPSYPVFSTRGHREDWNIRLLVGMNGIIDSEARVIEWGCVVNKAKGAHIEEVDQVLERARLSPEERREIIERVNTTGLAIARALRANYLGIDIIIAADREVFVLEVNSGAVGGLVSLAEIRPHNQRLLAPTRFLKTLDSHPVTSINRPAVALRGEIHELIPDPFAKPVVRAELNRYLQMHLKAKKPGKRENP